MPCTRRRACGEDGDTLLEILVAVSVMSIAFTALIGGLAAAIRLSAVHRGSANANVVLVSAAESVKSQTYVPCPDVSTSSYVPSQNVTLPSGWSSSNLVVTAVKRWNGSVFATTCPATDGGLQLVTITATSPDGKSTDSVDVVKRPQI